jgi:hypothetical protein
VDQERGGVTIDREPSSGGMAQLQKQLTSAQPNQQNSGMFEFLFFLLLNIFVVKLKGQNHFKREQIIFIIIIS